ncbi:MAG: (d)CMP kinase [Victivallales bacterium]|nr:(d)CMP kinase [Victivallales bacterium]
MDNSFFQVAIDGPAASGKSTVARLLASRIGGYYINTGDMYRALAWTALEHGVAPATAPAEVIKLLPLCDLRYRIVDEVPTLFLNGEVVPQAAIRSPEVSAVVSPVAAIPEVREWMLERQRECRKVGNIIMEGRDIGTVIFPQAKFKFFVTASPMERARRRLAQKGEVAEGATLESVAADIAKRDEIDSTRAVAPLRPAEDAATIMTDGITAEEVADLLAATIRHTNKNQ